MAFGKPFFPFEKGIVAQGKRFLPSGKGIVEGGKPIFGWEKAFSRREKGLSKREKAFSRREKGFSEMDNGFSRRDKGFAMLLASWIKSLTASNAGARSFISMEWSARASPLYLMRKPLDSDMSASSASFPKLKENNFNPK
jgi:hypothetical protein